MPSRSGDPVFTFELLGYSIAAFALLLLINVAVWRLFRIRKQILWLFTIFLCLSTSAYLAALAAGWAFFDATSVYLLVIALSAAYIFAYPIMQAESPTVVMVRLLHRHNRSGGLARAQILGTLRNDKAFEYRLRDLQENGLVRGAGGSGSTELSGFGRAVAAVFYYYRRVLGLPLGKG